MRTVLAAAAAGALVLGSAGGAIADPGKAKGPKASASETTMTKLQTVNIKRHKKIDLADLPESINLRAKVRYSKKVAAGDALQTVGLQLAVYDKKVGGTMVGGSESTASDLALKAKSKDRKNQFYAGSAVIADVWLPGQLAVLAGEVAENGKAYICISGVTGEFNKYSQQTRKRLGMKADGSDITMKTVRDCVKVVNSAAETTPDPEPAS
jgi:hypothetical protein